MHTDKYVTEGKVAAIQARQKINCGQVMEGAKSNIKLRSGPNILVLTVPGQQGWKGVPKKLQEYDFLKLLIGFKSYSM